MCFKSATRKIVWSQYGRSIYICWLHVWLVWNRKARCVRRQRDLLICSVCERRLKRDHMVTIYEWDRFLSQHCGCFGSTKNFTQFARNVDRTNLLKGKNYIARVYFITSTTITTTITATTTTTTTTAATTTTTTTTTTITTTTNYIWVFTRWQ